MGTFAAPPIKSFSVALLVGAIMTFGGESESFANPKSDAVAAEILFREGNQLVGKGQCAEAVAKFLASEKADHSKGTLYNLANAYECSGRLASAWKTFLLIVNEPTSGPRSSVQTDAEKRAEALEPRLPKLTVNVPNTLSHTQGLEILVDDEPLPSALWNQSAPMDPGIHKVSARAPGKISWSKQSRDLKEKDAEQFDAPEHLPDEPLPKQRIAAIVVGGFGLAAGIGAAIGGGLAFDNADEATSVCNASPCIKGSREWFLGTSSSGERTQQMMDRALMQQNVAIAFTAVSTAFLGTAAILWVTAPAAKKDAAFQFLPIVAPHYAGAAAQFTF